MKQFHTDGWKLFAKMRVATSFFKDLEYEDDTVSQYWPLGRHRPVVLDPARSFGQPIDPETGVPTRVLYGMHCAGDSIEDVARSFCVKPDAVRTAIEYERSLAQAA